MASQHHRSTSVAGHAREKTYFELQREELIGEIAMVRLRWVFVYFVTTFGLSQYAFRGHVKMEVTIGNLLTFSLFCTLELRACSCQHQQAEPVVGGSDRGMCDYSHMVS